MKEKYNKPDFFCLRAHNCLKCFLHACLDDSVITLSKKSSGAILQLKSKDNRLFFLLEGKGDLMCEHVPNSFSADSFFLIPRNSDYTINITEDSTMVIVNVPHRFIFCEQFSLQQLQQLKKPKNDPYEMYLMPIHPVISIFLKNITELISAEMQCIYLQEIKLQELLFYLRSYYSMNDLLTLFSPILNGDTDFTELIYQNYESVKHIAELAAITHYSESGFKKRFLKVFGISPLHWIQKEKAKKLHQEITRSQKPFKEISIEYKFHSISHFNRFCKKTFGIPPAKLRKQTIENFSD